MGRVNIFLSDELLKAVDEEATTAELNRSALIQAALTALLAARRKEREEAEIRLGMEKACRGMDALAEKLGNWDPVSVIREFRDRQAVKVGEKRKPYASVKRKGRA